MQFVERTPWIPTIHSDFYIGVDGISMPLILLTTFTTVLIVIASWRNVEKRVAQYFAAFLILEGLMIGVFAALDGVLFYVFWEAMLIPMFIIIGVWGGPRRVYATIKFFLYTFIGSLLMLVALIYLYLKAGSYELAVFQHMPLTLHRADLHFPGVLRRLRGEGADVAGAYLVAGRARRGAHRRLGGAGGHHAEDGRLRLSALLAADRARCQPRARLADHRAVADRGGVHRLRRAGAARHEEADRLFLDRAHGLRHLGHVHRISDRGAHRAGPAASNWAWTAPSCRCSRTAWCRARCSCASACMYDRVHSREISAYGGVVNTMPKFAAFMVLFALANSGLPGTSGFVGEFLVILASFKANVWYAFLGGHHPGAGRGLYAVAGEARHFRRGRPTTRWPRSTTSTAASSWCWACSPRRCCWSACGPRRCSMSCAPSTAAFGPAAAGLEDRSLRLRMNAVIQCRRSSMQGLVYARPEIFLGWRPARF